MNRCPRCNRQTYRSYDERYCFVHGTVEGDNYTGIGSNAPSVTYRSGTRYNIGSQGRMYNSANER